MSEWGVRRATELDIPWVVEQAKEFIEYLQLPLKWNEAHMYGVVEEYVKSHHVILAIKGTLRVGVAAGFVTPHLLDPSTKVFTEIMWWVRPEWRGSRAGVMLLNAMEYVAKSRGAFFVLSTEEHSPLNKASLAKRGYKLRELSYVKEM